MEKAEQKPIVMVFLGLFRVITRVKNPGTRNRAGFRDCLISIQSMLQRYIHTMTASTADYT
jgi:hypothetical protein